MKSIRYLLFSIILLVTVLQTKAQYNYSINTDGMLLAVGALGVSSYFLVSNTQKPLTVSEINSLSRNNINAFDRFATNNYSTTISTISDLMAGVIVIAPAILLLNQEVKNQALIVSLMYSEILAYNLFVPTIVKNLADRPRPYVYNPATPLSVKTKADATRSFFSNHTSFAFSSAVFISKVFADCNPDSKYKPLVWGGTLLVASTIGYLRIEAGQHFPTDVLTGAAFGALLGYGIPAIHKASNTKLSLIPTINENGISSSFQMVPVSLLYRF